MCGVTDTFGFFCDACIVGSAAGSRLCTGVDAGARGMMYGVERKR